MEKARSRIVFIGISLLCMLLCVSVFVVVQNAVAKENNSESKQELVASNETKPAPKVDTTTTSSITLSWDAVPGAAYYAIATQNDDGKSYTTYSYNHTDTTYTITGLEDSKTYKCLVQANINGKWSSFDNSDLVQATTKGIRPVVTAEPTGDGQVTLTWEAIENAENYVAYEVIGSSYVQIGDILPSSATSVVKDNLANYYEHTFLVQAKVGGQWSKFSERNYAYATPTGTIKPSITSTSVLGTSITLNWNQVPGAAYYAIATQNDDGQSYTTYTLDLTDTTYTITGLEDNKTYKCLVQANINGKWSSFGEEDLVEVTTNVTRPVVTATATGDGEVTLTWDAIKDAENYVAYEVVGDKYVQIGDILPSTILTATKDNLANGYEHTFLVQAKVGEQWSKFDESNYAKATPTGTTKPTTQFISSTDTTVTLGWNSVPGAEKYAVAVRDHSDKYHTVYVDPTETSATITGLIPNTNYRGLVQCQIYGKWSAYTEADHVDAKTDGPVRPLAVLSTKDSNNPTLTFYYDKEDHYAEGESFQVTNDYALYPAWQNKMFHIHGKTVVFDKTFASYKPTITKNWFYFSQNLKTIEGMENLNTSEVTNMHGMFGACNSLKSIDLSHMDTSKVTDMAEMFDDCYSLTTLDVSKFNTQNVTDMHLMFALCGKNKQTFSVDVRNFKTQNVKDMSSMFAGSKVSSLNLTSFDTRNVEDFWSMFARCTKLTSVNLSSFDTSSAKHFNQMFDTCSSLTSLDVSNFTISNNSEVTAFCSNCTNLKNVVLPDIDVSSVSNFTNMFRDCTSLEKIYCNSDLSKGKISRAYRDMFKNCKKLPHYNSAKVDNAYAYPDNGTTGYFTKKA